MKHIVLLFSMYSFLNYGQSGIQWTNTNVPEFPLNNIIESNVDQYLSVSNNSLYKITNNGSQINQMSLFNQDTIISLTLRVDMSGFVNNGGVINPNGIFVVGEFNSLNSAYPNWNNSLGSMTNLGNNIWSYNFTYFQSQSDLPLHFKFVNGMPNSGTSVSENLTNCSFSNVA